MIKETELLGISSEVIYWLPFVNIKAEFFSNSLKVLTNLLLE